MRLAPTCSRGYCCDPAGVTACAEKNKGKATTCKDESTVSLLSLSSGLAAGSVTSHHVKAFSASVTATRRTEEPISKSKKWQKIDGLGFVEADRNAEYLDLFCFLVLGAKSLPDFGERRRTVGAASVPDGELPHGNLTAPNQVVSPSSVLDGRVVSVHRAQGLKEKDVHVDIYEKNSEIGGTWSPELSYSNLYTACAGSTK
ncbi:hypothetical protein AK812_SmicGene31380 [Symbiodinium microadriaticum]|uniref:Uncharacterized protein n=1 Tax=Symbiodinium microadriaticum TaxID=2951 RepID=A0A1Q9CWY5_SYMMI|nr:hypothetical protein AK812_SmicGene31380 [Symbiodinium microadriaticum]